MPAIQLSPANRRRVKTAADMLKARGARGYDPYSPRSNLVDALTDLRHWAEKRGIDFHAALDMSYQHYLCEKAGIE